jgi:glyoxylase-like metal-dependent hydrolase (beta-lactamase superfamily II)
MKVSDAIERIDGTMANSYFIMIDGMKIIVDAGTPGSGKKIMGYLENNRIKPDAILITHYHVDHVGGLPAIYEKYHPEIYVPVNELSIISGSEPVPLKPFMPKFASTIMRARKIKDLKPSSEMNISGIELIKTPGHTRDSTSYYAKEQKVLFTGDAAVNLKGIPGYNKMFSADQGNAEKSLKAIRDMDVLILPGHGDKMDLRKDI